MSYFLRVRNASPTRMWINNPAPEDLGPALDQGAVGCTTNPSFVAGLLRRRPAEVQHAVEACLAHSSTDEAVASRVQETLVAPICERFLPIYQASAGREGLVTIQGSPYTDADTSQIIDEARQARAIAPNAAPKIPATAAGLAAMEVLLAEGHPLVMTEVFSLAQLAEIARRVAPIKAASKETPALYVAAITGIFGNRLRAAAEEEGRIVDRSIVEWAGVAFARRCRSELVARDYPYRLLFGGARSTRDFTGLVGEADHITVNLSTVEEILAQDPPVERTIDAPVPQAIMDTLMTFREFRIGMGLEALSVESFESFGPVRHFRDAFVAGWSTLRQAVTEARARSAVHAVAPGRAGP